MFLSNIKLHKPKVIKFCLKMEMEVYTYLAKISTCIKMALCIYIYILERERDHVSLKKQPQKITPKNAKNSYLSCRHQVGQWLSDHDALQSVTGELMGEWYQVESQGRETHLKIQ